jgi:hypothetical protein
LRFFPEIFFVKSASRQTAVEAKLNIFAFITDIYLSIARPVAGLFVPKIRKGPSLVDVTGADALRGTDRLRRRLRITRSDRLQFHRFSRLAGGCNPGDVSHWFK